MTLGISLSRCLRWPACFGLGLLSFSFALAQTSPARRVEIPNAAQPQLAVAGGKRVYLAYGYGTTVFVARSDDGGATFSPATKVVDIPKLMLGMRRGPRIAAHGDRVTVTLIAHELLAFHSSDAGRSWSAPVTLNEVPTSAQEGLHDLAAGPDGAVFVTWLDMRNQRMELWGADSADSGRTWSRNTRLYHAPEKSICECCHPTALFDAAGNLAVMWRNSIAGSRDMWLATRLRGEGRFSPPRKLGDGTWTLNSCPMDGGRIVALGNGKFASVWQRAGEVFFCPETGAEIKLGSGKQPVAIVRQGQPCVVWQNGPQLVTNSAPEKSPAAKLADDGRFAVLVSPDGDRGIILAYEQGPVKTPRIVIERL